MTDWFVINRWWDVRLWLFGVTKRMSFVCYEFGPIRVRKWR